MTDKDGDVEHVLTALAQSLSRLPDRILVSLAQFMTFVAFDLLFRDGQVLLDRLVHAERVTSASQGAKVASGRMRTRVIPATINTSWPKARAAAAAPRRGR